MPATSALTLHLASLEMSQYQVPCIAVDVKKTFIPVFEYYGELQTLGKVKEQRAFLAAVTANRFMLKTRVCEHYLMSAETQKLHIHILTLLL